MLSDSLEVSEQSEVKTLYFSKKLTVYCIKNLSFINPPKSAVMKKSNKLANVLPIGKVYDKGMLHILRKH